ncbi:hypothetical protein OSB04_005062 [Centaurea solstitialis]|uniref:Uncharacterized protein n=1 Tax=Centaurea solstitialis TaxID=347529 RepID=A0AA38TYB4_9ASTR|nr:hypothetical protein OSB04_005062 [Centaurea solstitialis]
MEYLIAYTLHFIRNFGYTASTSGSQALHLRFLNGIPSQVSTGRVIKSKEDKSLIVALVDGTGSTVKTGDGAAATVEIVALEGDSNDDEAGNWSSGEFNSKIVVDWDGKKALQGNTSLNLKEGTGYVDNISFTHNSKWKKQRNLRLGARAVNAVFIKEAKQNPFSLRTSGRTVNANYLEFAIFDQTRLKKSNRNLIINGSFSAANKKHDIPYLDDDVWRLRMIRKKGPLTESLAQAKIKTVGDFIVRRFLNLQCLVEIFDRSKQGKNLKSSVDHALTCPTKLKYSSNHEQKPEEDAKKLVISAFENWGDVMHVDEDQLVAGCSKPTVHGFAKTEMVTPCVNTLVTTYNKNIYQGHLDSIKHYLFGNMLSDEQHPNPDLLPESSRKQYHEIRSGFEIELFGTKTVIKKRSCRRWRMLVLVVTFTRPLPRRSLDDIRSHKKPRLS